MATLALAAVGAAVGSSVLPAGVGFLGVALSGATIGSQVGAFAGAYVDAALFGASGQGRAVEGPRLSDLRVTASTEGSPLPRIYGRARVGGQIIWATDLEEEIVKTTESAGSGKGGSGGGATLTQYRYYANFAVALGECVVTRIGNSICRARRFACTPAQRRKSRTVSSRRAMELGMRQRIAVSPISFLSACRLRNSAIACRSFHSKCSAVFRARRRTFAVS